MFGSDVALFGSDVASADVLAFVFSMIGGFFMGSYPVPIKAPSVLNAKVHPLVFQCYKSFWVCILGFSFILLNLARGLPAYVFTFWGILGATAWIPSGLATIASVPRLGIGMATVVNTGTSATLQFLVGLLLGERMKEHGPPGHQFVLAPVFLVGIVVGMAGLVLAPTLKCQRRRQVAAPQGEQAADLRESIKEEAGQEEAGQDGTADQEGGISQKNLVFGLVFAFTAGVFSALQFAVISIGKKIERPDCTDCPEFVHFTNEFDSFGSYMTSFGIGAGLMTPLYLGVFAGTEKCQGKELPQSHFEILRILGSIAGWCWFLGNCFQSAAVNRGGSSVMGPANQAIQLITSGAWGLVYYKEVTDPKRIACWLLCATWTVVFVILLGRERNKS